MRPHFDLRSRLPLLVLLVVAAPFTANASPILPGTTMPFPPNTVFQGGVILAGNNVDVTSTDYTATTGFRGMARTAVVSPASGFLDFYYQFSNDPSSTDPITGHMLSGFAGFATDVFNVTNGSVIGSFGFIDGTVDSPSVSRSADGADILFNYHSLAPIMPGQTGFTLLIRTNATTFNPTQFSHTIFGSVATAPGFQPAAVPEPATVLLLGAGLAGVVAKVRGRRKERPGEEK